MRSVKDGKSNGQPFMAFTTNRDRIDAEDRLLLFKGGTIVRHNSSRHFRIFAKIIDWKGANHIFGSDQPTKPWVAENGSTNRRQDDGERWPLHTNRMVLYT